MMRERFATFFAYSLMALALLVAGAFSIAITYVLLSWAFGWR